jgi:DivIVA domain-containing protein
MSDLDLPLLPSADQIRRCKFATVRRGYDPDQVDDYLKQVAEQVEALETDLRDERLATARQAPAAQTSTEQAPLVMTPGPAVSMEDENAAYDRISKRFATVLRAADEEAQKLIEQARAEATKLVDEARAEADRIRVDAQANAEQARTASEAELRRAREETDRVLGGLEQRRGSLLGQMHEMQSRLLAVAQNLEIPDGDEAHGAHTSAPGQQAAASPAQQPTTPSEPQPTGDRPPANADATVVPEAAPVKEPAPVPVGQAATESETVDPRYEDMWASTETRQVDIPDLSSLDIDFDDEKKD